MTPTDVPATTGEALTAETLAAMYRTASAACACCGEPATCLGAYAGAETEQYGCDECCGHGNEDGHCEEVGSVDTLRANSLALLAEVRRLTAALDGIRDTVELPATATTTEVVAAVEERAGMLAHAVQSWKARASGMEAAEREIARLRAELVAARTESSLLFNITRGRLTPPDGATMEALDAAGGCWLVSYDDDETGDPVVTIEYLAGARDLAKRVTDGGNPARWIAVDRFGHVVAPREPADDVARDAPGVG